MLLILQDRDSRCDAITRQLDTIPHEIASDEAAIRQLQAKLDEAGKELRALEVRRLDLEGQIEQAEAAILKYKTQQMMVKKNEEYTALEHEIHVMREKISDLEDAELLVLEEIDLKKAALEELKQSVAAQQQTFEVHIDLLRQNFDSFSAELADARAAVQASEQGIAPTVLQQYRYVKSQLKRPPVVVQLEDGRCQGCHLKVSGEIESEARRADQLVRCDSCGRILYFDR